MSFPGLAHAAVASTLPAAGADLLRIGSKRFTESYIVAQLLAQTAQHAGAAVEVRQGLGNTAIVFAALRSGGIDLYADYTGTVAQEILKDPQATSMAALRAGLAPLGLGVDIALGFNNGYALAMHDDTAQRLGVAKLSDLARQPASMRLGLSNEFIGRADGWVGLAKRYGLPQRPQGLDHGLAYDALQAGQVDAIDIYTTDAKIGHLRLRVLADDAAYFPRYDAVVLYRLDVPQRFPAAWAAMQRLRGTIDERRMIAMNARAEIDGVAFDAIARDHLAATPASPPTVASALPARPGAPSPALQASAGEPTPMAASPGVSVSAVPPPSVAAATSSFPTTTSSVSSPPAAGPGAVTTASATQSAPAPPGWWAKLWADDLARLTGQHLFLVFVAVGLAVAVGVPLAVAVAPHAGPRALLLGATGLLQTVPALALLAVLISALGRIGTVPALAALVLYALLPIVRNTVTGLSGVPAGLKMAALALGLTGAQRLRHVELPLALPVILAGVRTATTIAVGMATIAAFIGAGGYGERIVTGLALNDRGLLLAGALPAAALALLLEGLFGLAARQAAPRAAR